MNGNFQKYQNKNRLHRYLLRVFLDEVCKFVERTRCETVLDVGCAEGFVLNELFQRGVAARLIGIDVDAAAIARGKQLFPHLDLRHGDGLQIDAIDGSYDLVLALEILEHLNEPELLLAELRRVSRRHCIVSVPHEPWFCLANLARLKNVSRWGNDIEHLNHWNPRVFPKFLEANDLKILDHRLPFPWMLYRCEVQRVTSHVLPEPVCMSELC